MLSCGELLLWRRPDALCSKITLDALELDISRQAELRMDGLKSRFVAPCTALNDTRCYSTVELDAPLLLHHAPVEIAVCRPRCGIEQRAAYGLHLFA
jgi:hypothetical protein